VKVRTAARWLAIAVGGALALGWAVYAVLPERWAVNAPLLHMLFGRAADALSLSDLQARVRPAPGFSIGIFW
jgi:hypothetical protein